MSNTTRLGGTDLVNIAKQRFDKQQRSKLPSVIVQLPSGGKIYPNTHPLSGGTVEMRYMTAYDEDILTNMSYIREGVMFDKLLESLVISDIQIEDIASSDRDALIIAARIAAYGAEYPVEITDPKINKPLKRTVDLRNLKTRNFTLTPNELGEFEYTIPELDVTLYFTYNINLQDFKTVSDMLAVYITAVNGNREKLRIEEFIRYEFLAGPAKKFRTFLQENAPGIDYTYEFEGEAGGTFQATFPIGTDLFWF